MRSHTGSPDTRLVIIRGNSASGKSTVAARLRERIGRGITLIGQDYVRRILLQEHDRPGAVNITMIDTIARTALDHGYDVIIEGILTAEWYGPMLTDLAHDHLGHTVVAYLDMPLEETLRRHNEKPLITVGDDAIRSWYRPHDLLPDLDQLIFGPEESVEDMVRALAGAAGFRSRDDAQNLPAHSR